MVSKVMGSVLGGGAASANTAGQAASQAALAANATKLSGLSDTLMKTSGDLHTTAKGLYDGAKPLTDLSGRVASDASNYDSQANQDLAAGTASADVNQSFDKSNGMLERQLTRNGANPNSGAAVASLRDAQIQRAATEAGAMTTARRGTIDKAIGLRSAGLSSGVNMTTAGTGVTGAANNSAGHAISALNGATSSNHASANVGTQINADNMAVTNTNNKLGMAGLELGSKVVGVM